jgi:hypothetical protein
MNRLTALQDDLKRIQNLNLSGQWRLILLMLGFNILLIVTLLLSIRQQELEERYELVVQTYTIMDEQIVTLEAIESITITKVVEPGFTPPATPVEP